MLCISRHVDLTVKNVAWSGAGGVIKLRLLPVSWVPSETSLLALVSFPIN